MSKKTAPAPEPDPEDNKELASVTNMCDYVKNVSHGCGSCCHHHCHCHHVCAPHYPYYYWPTVTYGHSPYMVTMTNNTSTLPAGWQASTASGTGINQIYYG